jgi:hypothetical protein
MRLLFGARYTDLGPFRVIRREALERLQMKDTNFGGTIEMQIKAHRAGLRILELPVNYWKRIASPSKISGNLVGTLRAGGKILWVIAKYGLSSERSAPASRHSSLRHASNRRRVRKSNSQLTSL